MDGTEADRNENDLIALTALQADAQELEFIEKLLDRFNVFETIGFVDQELMHSRFLAFLLDPRQNHGLGDLFLRRVLREASANDGTKSLPLFQDLDRMTLDHTLVRREHQHIDILLMNEAHKLAVIIENKVWTTEHSNQLNRYYQQVKNDQSGWHIIGIYLTPHGGAPSHKEYIPMSYATVCEILSGILKDLGSNLNPDVRMSIEHYIDMVRSNIVSNSEIASLRQKIYQKHKRALDHIYEHRPDPQGATKDLLLHLIGNTEGLIHKGRYRNTYLYFCPRDWDVSRGFLGFVFHNLPGELVLYMETSWGDKKARERLFVMGRGWEPLFNHLVQNPGRGINPKLYRRTFLTPRFYEEASDNEREQEIRRQWGEFLNRDLPRMKEIIGWETWIWEPVEADG